MFGEDVVGMVKDGAVGLRAEEFEAGLLSAMLGEFHCVVLEDCVVNKSSRLVSF